MPSPLRKPCGWTWWRKGWLRKCIQWNGSYGTYAWSFTTIKLFSRWSRKHMSCFLLTSFLLSPNFWDDRILQQLSSEDKDYRAECQKEAHAGQGRIFVSGAWKKIHPHFPDWQAAPTETISPSLLVQTEKKGNLYFHYSSCPRNIEIDELIKQDKIN